MHRKILFVFHNFCRFCLKCNAHAILENKKMKKVFLLLNCVHRVLLQNCYLALGFCTPFHLETQLNIRRESLLCLSFFFISLIRRLFGCFLFFFFFLTCLCFYLCVQFSILSMRFICTSFFVQHLFVWRAFTLSTTFFSVFQLDCKWK